MLSQGTLTEGGRLRIVDLLVLASLDQLLLIMDTILTFFYKSYLNEEVNRIEPSLSVSVPWLSFLVWPNRLSKKMAVFNFFHWKMDLSVLDIRTNGEQAIEICEQKDNTPQTSMKWMKNKEIDNLAGWPDWAILWQLGYFWRLIKIFWKDEAA